MYFQLVDNQVLSTQGQPDVNLHRLTAPAAAATPGQGGTGAAAADAGGARAAVAGTLFRRLRCRLGGV